MRLFVAVRPPDPVLDEIGALADRLRRHLAPDGAPDPVRWTGRGQWHVTLRFLGQVAEPEAVAAALAAAPLVPTEAAAGPAVTTLGPAVLCLPVAGLEDLARTVREATAHLGRALDVRPYTGHLTLGRARGRRGRVPRPPDLAIATRWPVTEVHLVRSHTHPDGARYETLATFTCAT